MFKKPMIGAGLFLALISLATAGYLSQGKINLAYHGGRVGILNLNDQVEVNLFNPSTDQWVDYSLSLPAGTETGLLAPLASTRFNASGEGNIRLSADADLVAWRITRNIEDGLETGRSTLPFASLASDGNAHLFPWMQASSGGVWSSGYLSVYNTSPFTANISYTVIDAATGAPSSEPSFVTSPFSNSYVPAVTNFVGPDTPKYGLLWASNGASLLASYTSREQFGTYSYWSEPTSLFSSLTFRPDTSDGDNDLGGDSFGLAFGEERIYHKPGGTFSPDGLAFGEERIYHKPGGTFSPDGLAFGEGLRKAARSSSSFSGDHLLFEAAGVSTHYSVLNKELSTGLVGEVNGDLAQTGQAFNAALVSNTAGAPAILEGADLVPGSGHYSGSLDVYSQGYSPASMAVYTADGDRSVAGPASRIRERAVFPVDGREGWNDQLSASAFIFNNKDDEALPIAVGLLDEDGNLLDVRYPRLEIGATEITVGYFVDGFPDTRALLFESSRSGSFWSAHMMVTGSGSGISQSIVDYVPPAHASGCGSIGLGPENYYNWGSGYSVPCEGQAASVLGLVTQVNLGNPPPYND